MSEPFEEEEELGESFRQSRKELWVMLGTWLFFALWTWGYNSIFAGEKQEASVDTLFGMPRWVVVGVAGPWLLALVVTVWFATSFMKDTSLGGREESE